MGRTAEELGTAKIDYIYVNMFGDTFLAPGTNTKNFFVVISGRHKLRVDFDATT